MLSLSKLLAQVEITKVYCPSWLALVAAYRPAPSWLPKLHLACKSVLVIVHLVKGSDRKGWKKAVSIWWKLIWKCSCYSQPLHSPFALVSLCQSSRSTFINELHLLSVANWWAKPLINQNNSMPNWWSITVELIHWNSANLSHKIFCCDGLLFIYFIIISRRFSSGLCDIHVIMLKLLSCAQLFWRTINDYWIPAIIVSTLIISAIYFGKHTEPFWRARDKSKINK